MKYFQRSSSNYPYACTRVRAKRRFLIKKDEYLRLSVMSLPEISRYIGETQYKNEIETMSSSFTDATLIERATNTNLAETFHQIIGFCKGDLKTMVSLYIGKVDSWNIKTILRGKFHDATPEEILHEIIQAGTMKPEKIESLAKASGIAEAIEGLKGTIFHVPLQKILHETGEAATITTLMPFENEIDKAYYSHLLAAVSSIRKSSTRQFLNFIKKEIDMENLITLFKIKFELLHHEKSIENIEDYMIPGGLELKEAQLKKLIATNSFSQFLSEIRHYSFYEDIKEAVELVEERNTLKEVTREAEKHILGQANRFATLYPLSVLPVINYLILKKKEVDNLRIIASGRASGLDTDTIRELLVM